MRLYRAITNLIEAATQALNAWAEAERTQTLETEFANADWENGAITIITDYED